MEKEENERGVGVACKGFTTYTIPLEKNPWQILKFHFVWESVIQVFNYVQLHQHKSTGKLSHRNFVPIHFLLWHMAFCIGKCTITQYSRCYSPVFWVFFLPQHLSRLCTRCSAVTDSTYQSSANGTESSMSAYQRCGGNTSLRYIYTYIRTFTILGSGVYVIMLSS